MQNWIAGFLILLRRPFHRGDQIKVGDIEGTVQAVEPRATLLKTFAGRLVIIPNSEICTRSVTVHTAYEMRRLPQRAKAATSPRPPILSPAGPPLHRSTGGIR